MSIRNKCAAITASIFACACAVVAQSAPTEYSTLYLSDSPSEQSSGTSSFIYDPKTQRVSELVWDFGNGWKGALVQQDPALAHWLLADSSPKEPVRLVPPAIVGQFSAVQWYPYGGSAPISLFTFSRPDKPDIWGSLATQKRRPEVNSIFVDRFTYSRASALWRTANSGWAASQDTYKYNTAAPAETAISTLNSYASTDVGGASAPVLTEPYWVSTRLLNSGANQSALTGLVYNYQDSSNFNEVVLSALGAVELLEIRNGVFTTKATDTYEESGPNQWVDVELRRTGGRTTVLINGEPIFKDVLQNTLVAGRVGLVTHRTAARFDDFRIARPRSHLPFKETFGTSAAAGWTPQGGTWNVVHGEYVAPVQPRAISMSPARVPLIENQIYAFRARMNPGTAEGAVGITWNDGRNELVFKSDGGGTLNRYDQSGLLIETIEGGFLEELANTPDKWFVLELSVERNLFRGGMMTNIYANGRQILHDLNGVWLDSGHGAVGLVAHNSPGRFDDVEFRETSFPRNYAQNFEYIPRSELIVRSGVWTAVEETLESQRICPRDIVLFGVGGDVDSVYRARLFNEYSGSSNLIGLVTNYNDDGDYYETLFSGAGEVVVNKVVKGQVIRQATARYSVPPRQWFTVELRRTGTRTAVKVNGQTILSDLPQGQIRGGLIGLKTQWSRGKFDDISWTN